MFNPDLLALAETFLQRCRVSGVKVATAESCSGGLLAGLLTEIPGASDVFERGFVTYANQSKTDLLHVAPEHLIKHGAVSKIVAQAMAQGLIRNTPCDLGLAITGIAGPDGGTPEKPVGLVYIAAARRGQGALAERRDFTGTRTEIRTAAIRSALELALQEFLA